MKCLYISDLDGTLLNSEKELSSFTIKTLNRLIADGLNFTVATARTAASALKILAGLDINVPVVLMNGVLVYDTEKGKYIKTEIIQPDVVSKISGLLKQFEINGFMYAIMDDKLVTYYESLNTIALQDFHNERVLKYYKSFEKVDSFLDKAAANNVIYFTLVDEQENLAGIYNAVKGLDGIEAAFYRDIYARDLWYLEIFSNKASKSNAVRFIREKYCFDRVIGFGDNLNDIPLFEACEECYATSNAVDELKARASGIIGHNNEDSVAVFIKERFEGPIY